MNTNKHKNKLFRPELMTEAFKQSFIKLKPATMVKNPVMFTVELGTLVMLAVILYQLFSGNTSEGNIGYNITVFLILFITVLFGNFAEAIAEARGKAQAESLRKTRKDTLTKKIFTIGETRVDEIKVVPSSQLLLGDRFVCEAGDVIPMDGEIIKGIATIDESAITGESAPVIREVGGDKSSVTGGTK